MRPLAVGLIAIIAISGGTIAYLLRSPAETPAKEYTPPTLEQIREVGSKQKMKSAERTDVRGVPHRFTDKDGKEVDLATYREQKKNVVLVVVKGLPQKAVPGNPAPGRAFCPGCLAQINALVANYGKFQEKNAVIVLMFPGPKDNLPLFLSDAKVDGKAPNPPVPFPLVTDADLSAVRSLGITGDLALPSTYILDTRGNVVFAYVAGPDTTFDRPPVSALLERLDKLKKDGT